MALVTVVVVAVNADSPAGQTYASTRLTLVDAAGAQQTAVVAPLPDGTSGAVFTVTPVGDGSVVAQAIDTNGNQMGSAASQTFTVPAPAQFPQPNSITVTVAL